MIDLTLENLKKIKAEALLDLKKAISHTGLEDWRIKYLGRKGVIPILLRGVKDLVGEERKAIGREGNLLRQELEQELKQKEQESIDNNTSVEEQTTHKQAGHIHPLTLTIRRIQQILSGMGFILAEGPLVEEVKYNFDQLNISFEHPARAETDTFYIQGKDDCVLRTQTSPVQLRAVLGNNLQPPFRMFSVGRVFRAEKADATHESTFYQVEGLVIGEKVTIADFKRDIEHFYSQLFGIDVVSRLRTNFFPFVEPGFEVDIGCVFCQTKGCRVCKDTGWIEMMGAGMVHPNVLSNMNIDANKFQGYAFGIGIDRLTMLRYGINDIRLFWSGDFNFLKQFS